ncbi:MAG: glycosyltransferase family 39 protein [Pseudomonadota bacterium]
MHISSNHAQARSTALWASLFLVALVASRVTGLFLSPLNLGPDEAQYWRWSTVPDWGYYSKPPLIAWIISTFASVFGDSEWAVRLPAPLLHGVTAALVFSLGRKMFNSRTGIFSAACYLLMPGVTFSSGVITTDAALLPCFAFSMLMLWRLRDTPEDVASTMLLGAAIAVGLLAKYAMVYAIICLVVAATIDEPTRRMILSKAGAIATCVALLIVSPHIAWNLANGLQTVNHTVDNANWGETLPSLSNGLQFIVDQMAIAGPFGLVTLFVAVPIIVRMTPHASNSSELRWLLAFCIPIILVVTAQAFVSRAHANWAATAYVAGSLVITAILLEARIIRKRWWLGGAVVVVAAAMFTPDLSVVEKSVMGVGFGAGLLLAGALSGWTSMGILWGNLAMNGVVAVIFTAMAIGPVSWSERLGFDQSFKRSRAWPETVAALHDAALETDADAVLVDERELWHAIDYYGRHDFPSAIYSWRRFGTQKSFAERHDIAELEDPEVLIASIKPHPRPLLLADFSDVEPVGEIAIPLGGDEIRRIALYKARDFDPLVRDDAWKAMLD